MKINKIIVAVFAALSLSISANAVLAEHANKHTAATQKVTAAINVNIADAKTLATLKRIGMKKAEAIVAYRQQHGLFKSVSDLEKVKGISEKIIELNKEKISVV